MSLKAKVEAIIYAAEEPITLEQIAQLLNDAVLADLAAARENAAIEQADQAAAQLGVNQDPGSNQDDAAPEEATLIAEPSDDVSEPSVQVSEETAAVAETASTAESAEAVSASASEHSEAATASEAEPTAEAAPVAEAEKSAEGEPSPAEAEPAPGDSASVVAPASTSRKRKPQKSEQEIAQDKAVRARIREVLIELAKDYASEDRGMEIRQVAGGFRMATKPEHHDVVRAFAKSLKPPIRLSLAALETLAVVAYKQPITAPEIADIRGIESASVIGTLLDRKLITTAGRKQVIGRPMQYKTSKDFLLRFGLNDVNELPSMEEFSQLAADVTILAPEAPAAEATPTEVTPTPEPTSIFESADADGTSDAVEPSSGMESPDAPETPETASAGTDAEVQPTENQPEQTFEAETKDDETGPELHESEHQ